LILDGFEYEPYYMVKLHEAMGGQVDENELIRGRRLKLEALFKCGINPYATTFKPTDLAAELSARYQESPKEASFLEENVSLTGRIVSFRHHGKASFAHIRDRSGCIQIYIREDEVGEEAYDLLKKLDVGDFIGVTGRVFRTKTGELTVRVKQLSPLAKALRPLPEKWHGLADVELRYRRRYLDFIANPEMAEAFRMRSRLVTSLRRFFDKQGFLEVETPIMQPIPGGAAARPFVTYHNALNLSLYLRVAPELHLKRLVVGGLERVYELGRNFRNEGISSQHNPEFTMLEFYQAYADYHDLMALTEELFLYLAQEVLGSEELTYQGRKIPLRPPWPRISLLQALTALGGLPSMDLETEEGARRLAREQGIPLKEGWGWGKILMELFEAFVQEKLVQPTFVLDLPVELSPLAKAKDGDHRLAQRFELFIAGTEVANAYSELNDPEEQRKRFEEQLKLRQQGDEEAQPMDEDFIQALEYGMPPTAGEGIGIDRLVMLFTNTPSIRDVILFPLLRPEKQG